MAKCIVYNRDTRDFDMYIGLEYIGSRGTYAEAERDLDKIYSGLLEDGVVA